MSKEEELFTPFQRKVRWFFGRGLTASVATSFICIFYGRTDSGFQVITTFVIKFWLPNLWFSQADK